MIVSVLSFINYNGAEGRKQQQIIDRIVTSGKIHYRYTRAKTVIRSFYKNQHSISYINESINNLWNEAVNAKIHDRKILISNIELLKTFKLNINPEYHKTYNNKTLIMKTACGLSVKTIPDLTIKTKYTLKNVFFYVNIPPPTIEYIEFMQQIIICSHTQQLSFFSPPIAEVVDVRRNQIFTCDTVNQKVLSRINKTATDLYSILRKHQDAA